MLNRVMFGIIRLDQHFARQFPASGASRHLSEQLKRSLCGTEIGPPEREVGGNDTNKSHALEIMALCDHLRANE